MVQIHPHVPLNLLFTKVSFLRFSCNILTYFCRVISETDEERKAIAEQNTPHFIVRLKDTEILENTFLRFMVKLQGEPRPKVQL